jgi:formamidopyrimidine-DNA glycosylase
MAIELPEAFHLAQQLDAVLKDKTITGVQVPERAAPLIRQGFISLHTTPVVRTTVSGATARGKWIFVALEPGRYLLFALETGGKLLYHPPETGAPAIYQVRIDFDDNSCLTVHIAGWGFAKSVLRRELDRETYPGRLGASPVDEHFTPQLLAGMVQTAAGHVLKQMLMDQRVLAGIGNGYVQDILFRAGLHPKRKAGSLDSGEVHRLHAAIQTTLTQAMAQGGRVGEVDLYGQPGGYQPIMAAAQVGKPCPICGTPIQRTTILGTASFLCPSCQPLTPEPRPAPVPPAQGDL